MKNRTVILTGLIITTVFLGWWFLNSGRRSQTYEKADSSTTNSSKVGSEKGSTNASSVSGALRSLKSKEEQMKELLDTENRKSLNLYGKVIDQYGEPVVGAKVKGSVLLNVNFTHSGGETYYTETDLEGRFKFVDLHGVELGIWPEKDDYSYDLKLSARRAENYYKADPEDPAVFIMWKVSGSEPMVHSKLDSRVPYDGRSAAFNLFTGKLDTVGDLRITLLRNPLQIKRGREQFDWNVQIEIIGGGLIEIKDPYPNLAPESDYQSVQFGINRESPDWTKRLTKMFYVHLQNGNYGRTTIDLTVDSERPDTGISVEAWLNPSGSRNLEYDSAKKITPERIAQIGLEKAIKEIGGSSVPIHTLTPKEQEKQDLEDLRTNRQR